MLHKGHELGAGPRLTRRLKRFNNALIRDQFLSQIGAGQQKSILCGPAAAAANSGQAADFLCVTSAAMPRDDAKLTGSIDPTSQVPAARGPRLDDDERLGQRVLVGDRQVDARSVPAGVIAFSRSAAPPVSRMVGRPDGRLTTPMSRQNTPGASPVPSALAQASLAAKRLA